MLNILDTFNMGVRYIPPLNSDLSVRVPTGIPPVTLATTSQQAHHTIQCSPDHIKQWCCMWETVFPIFSPQNTETTKSNFSHGGFRSPSTSSIFTTNDFGQRRIHSILSNFHEEILTSLKTCVSL